MAASLFERVKARCFTSRQVRSAYLREAQRRPLAAKRVSVEAHTHATRTTGKKRMRSHTQSTPFKGDPVDCSGVPPLSKALAAVGIPLGMRAASYILRTPARV